MSCALHHTESLPLLHKTRANSYISNSYEIKGTKYNHNFIAGLAYCTSTIIGLATLVSTATLSILTFAYKTQDLAADATDAVSDSLEEMDKIPESLGLRRYFSVITGISNTIEGVHQIKEAHHEKHTWGKIDGIIRVVRGVFEASSGFIQGTTTALKIWAEEKINLDALKIANVVGDFFACIQLMMISVSCFKNASLAGRIKHEINGTSHYSSIVNIFNKCVLRKKSSDIGECQLEFRQRQISVIKNILSNENKYQDKLDLKKTIGESLFHQLEKDLRLNNQNQRSSSSELTETIDNVLKCLKKSERNNTIIGILSLVGIAITLAADFATAGIASQILNIIKPMVSLGFFYFDALQFKSGVDESIPDSKFTRYMRIALTIICIAIAVAIFVSSSAASGGALPIALLVIGILCPLISLYINNNREQVAKVSKKALEFFKKLNPFKRQNITFHSKKFAFIELMDQKNIELTNLSKRLFKETSKAA